MPLGAKKSIKLEKPDALRRVETLTDAERSMVVARQRAWTRGRGENHDCSLRAQCVEDSVVAIRQREIDRADEPIPWLRSLRGLSSLTGLTHGACGPSQM